MSGRLKLTDTVKKSWRNIGLTLPGMEISEALENTVSQESMSLSVVFPVKISVQLENEEELKEHGADYGQSSLVSFANFDPLTSSWKTPQICLNGEWEEYSATWPRAGMMHNGKSSQLRPLVLPTFGKGRSLWPTPTASNTTLPRNPQSIARQVQKHHLNGYVAMWPTPTATDGKRYSRSLDYFKRRKAAGYYNLPTEIALSSEGPSSNGTYGQMNPMWVEWLMGFPLGWTDLED